jgi:DNA primase
MTHEMGPNEYLLAVPDFTDEELKKFREKVNSEMTWEQILRGCGTKYRRRNPSGTLYALCVFHYEKTPSFAAYPRSNTFICYGCLNNGDKYDFLCDRFNDGFQLSLPELNSLIKSFPSEDNPNQSRLPI